MTGLWPRIFQMFTTWMWLLYAGVRALGIDPRIVGLPQLAVVVFLTTRWVLWHYGASVVDAFEDGMTQAFWVHPGPKLVLPLFLAFDILVHFLPLALFGGLLLRPSLWVVAGLFFLLWYVWMRPLVRQVYVLRLSIGVYDQVVLGGTVFCAAMAILSLDKF